MLRFLKKKVPNTPTWGGVILAILPLTLSGYLLGCEIGCPLGILEPILLSAILILVVIRLLYF